MINEFIDKTIKMLERSDIIIHLPEHRKLKFDDEHMNIPGHFEPSVRPFRATIPF